MRVGKPPSGGRILVVTAHPDDLESWCAGTIALAIDRGCEVRALLVTSGDKGSTDPLATTAAVGALREREAMEGAARLGLEGVEFLRHPDGEVEDTRRLRGEMVRALRRWRPEVVFTHDPERPYPPYLAHRDHRVTGRATIDAAYPLARDRLAFSELEGEGLMAHAVRELWLFASAGADCAVDISETFERKVSARLAHESQTADPGTLRETWRQRAAAIGLPVGLACAETFTILRLD